MKHKTSFAIQCILFSNCECSQVLHVWCWQQSHICSGKCSISSIQERWGSGRIQKFYFGIAKKLSLISVVQVVMTWNLFPGNTIMTKTFILFFNITYLHHCLSEFVLEIHNSILHFSDVICWWLFVFYKKW